MTRPRRMFLIVIASLEALISQIAAEEESGSRHYRGLRHQDLQVKAKGAWEVVIDIGPGQGQNQGRKEKLARVVRGLYLDIQNLIHLVKILVRERQRKLIVDLDLGRVLRAHGNRAKKDLIEGRNRDHDHDRDSRIQSPKNDIARNGKDVLGRIHCMNNPTLQAL